MLRQLRDDTLRFILPVLALIGWALVLAEAHLSTPLPRPVRFISPGMLLTIFPLLAWAVRRLSYLAAVWVLILGCFVVDLLIVSVVGVSAAICLLALLGGLAALFVGVPAGALTAALFTLLLALAPPPVVPPDQMLRIVAIVETWGVFSLIWLTARPLLTTMDWSWSSHERSRRLLEQARDYQVQLKQALADLADANLQLTRLNRLAQTLRQAAENARRSKEQFVANVSHEFRTPLNMIIGYTEMILRKPKAYGRNIPPALLADLAVIGRNSQQLASLVDDVLDLSQIEAEQMALSREWADLREIIDAATIAVRPLFASKGLYLETEVPADVRLFCDSTRIREVVLNLLSNAGRFTEQGGVSIRAWREDNDIIVSVADTGPGIAPGDREKLFQPFQQLDGSLRQRYGGSGLGLTISKSFVELHGGKMWVESTKGSGATFYFRLPIEPPLPQGENVARWFSPHWQYEARTRRSLAPLPDLRPRFVVLEAGHTLQRLLARYLDRSEIVPVTSIEQAGEVLSRAPAQALLANAPSLKEGIHLVQVATALPEGVPAIVCSLPGPGAAAGGADIAGYLVKPVSSERLLAALDQVSMRGKKVLVVDDESEVLQLFWRILISAERGYRVLTAPDGQQALSLMRAERPDVLLLDLTMPEMDGLRVLEERSRDPILRDIPVIVVSARDPTGQLVASEGLAITRAGGLSVPQLLACIEAFTHILGDAGPVAGPVPPERPPG